MIELKRLKDPEKYERYYVMRIDSDDGNYLYLGSSGYGWYKNPADAREHYSVSAAKGARTRYYKRNDDMYDAGYRNLEIVKVVIDEYHIDRIC